MSDPTAPPPADRPRSAGRIAARALRMLVRTLKAVAWWFDSILGGDDYQRYIRHVRLRHPDAPVPSERDYWRERYDAAARNPANRCC